MNDLRCPYCNNNKWSEDNFTCGKYMSCISCGFSYGDVVYKMWAFWSIGFKVTYIDENGNEHKYEDYIKEPKP